MLHCLINALLFLLLCGQGIFLFYRHRLPCVIPKSAYLQNYLQRCLPGLLVQYERLLLNKNLSLEFKNVSFQDPGQKIEVSIPRLDLTLNWAQLLLSQQISFSSFSLEKASVKKANVVLAKEIFGNIIYNGGFASIKAFGKWGENNRFTVHGSQFSVEKLKRKIAEFNGSALLSEWKTCLHFLGNHNESESQPFSLFLPRPIQLLFSVEKDDSIACRLRTQQVCLRRSSVFPFPLKPSVTTDKFFVFRCFNFINLPPTSPHWNGRKFYPNKAFQASTLTAINVELFIKLINSKSLYLISAAKQIKSKYFSLKNFSLETKCLQLNTTYLLKDSRVLTRFTQISPKLLPQQGHAFVYFDELRLRHPLFRGIGCVESAEASLTAHLAYSPSKKTFKSSGLAFMSAKVARHMIDQFSECKAFKFRKPVYLRAHCQLGEKMALFKGKVQTHDLYLNNQPMGKAFLEFSNEKNKHLNFNAQVKSANFDAHANAKYNPQTHDGRIQVEGTLSPTLTLPFKKYFPNWWLPFWNTFKFCEKFPYTNFDLRFNTIDKGKFFLFGDVYANRFFFHDLFLRKFQLQFGNIPGYCHLSSKNFKTQEGSGACHVDWPYNLINESNEAWKIFGNGFLSVSTWQSILKIFSNDPNPWPIEKIFKPVNALARVIFGGQVYGSHYNGPTYQSLKLKCSLPLVNFFELPVENLVFEAKKWPARFDCTRFEGKIEKAPCYGSFLLSNNESLQFTFSCQSVPTELLLDRLSCLRRWLLSAPKASLEAYKGLLTLELFGKGNLQKPNTFFVNGQAEFFGEKLAKIHLLGPLSNLLFSKTFFSPSTIEFNRLKSVFIVENGLLKTSETKAYGPSTQADIQGTLNLNNMTLEANVRFSFFDYGQLKFPIIRQVLQIFQPISKGFGAHLSGSFREPSWTLGFNPLRFLFQK